MSPQDDIDDIKKRYEEYTHRLQELKEQRERLGIKKTPPEILDEIEYIEAKFKTELGGTVFFRGKIYAKGIETEIKQTHFLTAHAIVRLQELTELREKLGIKNTPPEILDEIRSLEKAVFGGWPFPGDIAPTHDPNMIILDSEQELTPDDLAKNVAPYLQAIADIQYLIDEIQEQPQREVKVLSIVQGSIGVSLSGATSAIELIMSVVVPWRYKHARAMAKLAESEKQVQIESARAEILASRKRLAQGKEKEKAELDLAKQRAEIKRIELENEKLRLELHREKIQLALDVLDKIDPNLDETAKIDYVTRLLRPLEVLISSDIEPRLIDSDEGSPKIEGK